MPVRGSKRGVGRWLGLASLLVLLVVGLISATPAEAQDDEGPTPEEFAAAMEDARTICEELGGSRVLERMSDDRHEDHYICDLADEMPESDCLSYRNDFGSRVLERNEFGPTNDGVLEFIWITTMRFDPRSGDEVGNCRMFYAVGEDPDRPKDSDYSELSDLNATIVGGAGRYEVEFECSRDATWWGHAVWEFFKNSPSDGIGEMTRTRQTHRIPLEVHQQHEWYVEEAILNNCSPPGLPASPCWQGENGDQWIGLIDGSDHDTYRHFIPDDCWGMYPSRNYDVHFDHGGNFGFSNKVWGWLTELIFQIGKSVLVLSFWLTGEAQSFDVVGHYGPAIFGDDEHVGAIEQLDVEIVEGLRLTGIAWLALIGYMGIVAARGRLSLAGGQLVITVVLLGLATVLLANPQGYMQGASDTSTGLSTQVLAAAASGTARDQCDGIDSDTEQTPRLNECAGFVRRDLLKQLHELFVEIPYDYINWGERITEDHPCRVARDRILSVGPHGTDAWPRLHMGRRDHGDACEGLMKFNEDANAGRFVTALVTSVAAVTLGVFLGLTALTVLIGHLATAFLFAVAPVAAVAAILPRGGRRLALVWVNTVVQAIVVVVAVSFLLAVGMLLIVPTLATAMGDDARSPVMVYVLVLGPLAAMGMARRKLLAGVKKAMDGVSDSATRFAPGASSAGFAQVGPLGGGGGGGGFGGGSGDRSIFDAARPGSVTSGLTVATTGTSAAIGAAGIVAGAVRMPVAAARGANQSRIARRRSVDLAYAKDSSLKVFDRAIAHREAGGAGSAGGGRMTDRDVLRLIAPPRRQRKHERRDMAEAEVWRNRAHRPRTWFSPIRESLIRTRVKTGMAFTDHNVLTRRGRAIRNDRERYTDPQVRLGKRAGSVLTAKLADVMSPGPPPSPHPPPPPYPPRPPHPPGNP